MENTTMKKRTHLADTGHMLPTFHCDEALAGHAKTKVAGLGHGAGYKMGGHKGH